MSNAEKKSSKKWLVNQTIDLELGFRLQKTRLLATKKKAKFQLREQVEGDKVKAGIFFPKVWLLKKERE